MSGFAIAVEGGRRVACVLVVDDDLDLLRLLDRLLRDRGHDVRMAADGFGAMQLAESQKFDVVVLDVEMPGMNGLETMQRIRCLQPDVPIILVSAYTALVSDATTPSASRCVVVTKELSPTALLGLIDSISNSAKTTSENRSAERGEAVRSVC